MFEGAFGVGSESIEMRIGCRLLKDTGPAGIQSPIHNGLERARGVEIWGNYADSRV